VAPASSVVGTTVAVVPAATEVVAKETKEVELGGLNSEEHSRGFEVISLEQVQLDILDFPDILDIDLEVLMIAPGMAHIIFSAYLGKFPNVSLK